MNSFLKNFFWMNTQKVFPHSFRDHRLPTDCFYLDNFYVIDFLVSMEKTFECEKRLVKQFPNSFPYISYV